MSTSVVPLFQRPVVRWLATSSWLVLVLVGLQTAWVGFAVAAVLVRRAWWRVAAVVGALTSIAMWPAHNGPWFATGHLNDTTLARAYLVTWTVLCLVAVVLNARVLTSRLASGPATLPATVRGVQVENPSVVFDSGPPDWGSPATSTAPVEPAVQDLIDVNTASAARLRTLPGATRGAVRRAVQHRGLVGRFRSLDDFAQAAGIEGTDLIRLRERASCFPPSGS